MPEYSGSLPSLELTQALWLAPLLPLIAAAACALWRGERARIGEVAIFGSAGALAIVLWKCAEVALALPERITLIDSVWPMLRVGSLDASFSFELGAAGGIAALGASIATLLLVVGLSRRTPSSRREIGGACLALGSFLLCALSDGFLLFVVGWGGLALAAYLLSGDDLEARDEREAWTTFAAQHAGSAMLVGGAALLLWGLGGVWAGDREFVPDFQPRLVAVAASDEKPASAPGEPVREGRGTLTMTALPGSTMKLGGADLCATDGGGQPGGLGTPSRPCREIARSPFVKVRVPASIHDVRVQTGPGTNDLAIEKLRITRGAETRIELTGPTLTFREIENQLAIRDLGGTHALRAALVKKKLFGLPVPALVTLLLLGAALVRIASGRVLGAASARPPGAALIAGLGLGAAVLLAVRASSVFALAPRATSVAALVVVLVALVAAARAALSSSTQATVSLALAAQLSIALAGAALGARGAGAVFVAVIALSAVALLTSKSTSDRGFVLGAAAATAAPVPALGVFFARDAALFTAFASEGMLVPGWAVAAGGALASALVAFALWRARTPGGAASPITPLVAVAGALALVFGLALVPLGDPVHAAPGAWLFAAEPTTAPVDPSLRYALLGVVFGLALAGFFAARRGATLPSVLGLGGPLRTPVAGTLAGWLERAGARLCALDRALERPFGTPDASPPLTESPVPLPASQPSDPPPASVVKKKKRRKRGSK